MKIFLATKFPELQYSHFIFDISVIYIYSLPYLPVLFQGRFGFLCTVLELAESLLIVQFLDPENMVIGIGHVCTFSGLTNS